MVRILTGTLIEVGKGKLTKADVVDILNARQRSCAGEKAPTKGLCMASVEY